MSQNYNKKGSNDDFDLKFFRNILIFISFLVYIIIFPPFLNNQVLGGHDVGSHLTYVRLMSDALSQGQFPVRWIEWITPGSSQPLFSYYQPLLYYLVQVPHLFGLSILNSLNLTVLFLWLFSGFMVYLFVRNITKNTLAGLSASCLYIFAPYHIVDVFVRSAYPESIALAFAPGMFWASERLIATGKRIYLGLLAIFVSATFVSHPPTLLMFGLPLIFYIGFLLFQEFKFKLSVKALTNRITLLFLGFVLGGLLSSFFALPALLEQNLTNASSLASGYLDFHSHFACVMQLILPSWGYGTSIPGCSDQISFQVGVINWIVIISFIGVLTFNRYRKRLNLATGQAVFWLVIAFFGMYMTLSFSQPLWEGLPYLPLLQFPWRFLSVVIFAASVLSGLLFMYVKGEKYKMLIFALLMIGAPLLSYSYLRPAAYLPASYFAQDSKDFYKGVSIGQQQGQAISGYFPAAMQVLPQPGTVPPSGIAVVSPKPGAKITGGVIKSTFTYKEIQINTDSPVTIELYIHYFPGWQFYINGELANPDHSNIYDFVFLQIPKGDNVVIAQFINTPLITLSNIISLLGILFLIVFLVFELIKTKLPKRRKRKMSNLSEDF